MVCHSNMTLLGQGRGWKEMAFLKHKTAIIPAANWILIKQRRRRGFRVTIYEAESAQHKAQRIGARHQRLQHLLFVMVGCGLFQGGQAQGQGGQFLGLATQVAFYPGMVSLGNLMFPQSCSAGPSTQKYLGISEINSHGPGDTHVSIRNRT